MDKDTIWCCSASLWVWNSTVFSAISFVGKECVRAGCGCVGSFVRTFESGPSQSASALWCGGSGAAVEDGGVKEEDWDGEDSGANSDCSRIKSWWTSRSCCRAWSNPSLGSAAALSSNSQRVMVTRSLRMRVMSCWW